MKTRTTLSSLIAVGVACSAVLAQDSVSKVQGLPGDALDAHLSSEQINNYVVDQAAVHSSWGQVFNVGPIVKYSRQRGLAPDFFTGLAGAQAHSRLTLANVPFARASYDEWAATGSGINGNLSLNDPGTPIDTSSHVGFQFAAATAEFGTGTTSPSGSPASLNGVVGAVVNFLPERPSRLYVTRVMGTINGVDDSCSVAQFGMGSVDETGAIHFRAEGFGATDCGGQMVLPGNNLFRVRALARAAGVVNTISSAGGGDAAATDWLLINSAVAHNTPNGIPNAIATRPLLIGTNFNKEYVFEQTAGSTVASLAGAHFAAAVTDHRGAAAYSPHNFNGLFGALATTGTSAILGYGSGGIADHLNAWGLDATGGFVAPIAFPLPAAISDPVQTWTSFGGQQFDHYHSQTAFRGGSSQIAIGRDQAGNLLLAAVVYYAGPISPPNTNRNNYVAVARIDPTSGAASWSVAGWTQEVPSSAGKTIFQNGTTPIGRMTGAFFGPAISAPMIDSVGNVWFLSAIDVGGQLSVGLLRAVYDAATFSYRLELVFKQGDVLLGLNSITPYQIRFLEIADADSVSSGTAFSGNISSSAYQNLPPASLAVDDARTLGGMVISAAIIYDVNGDGQFIRSVGPTGDPTSPDEDYQVLLYIGAGADCNENGIPDDKDLDDGTSSDVDANGVPDECEGVVGVADCFGDGSLPTACPCANTGLPGRGCENSIGTGGSVLSGSGTLNPDMVVLTASGELPTASSIFLQGDASNANGIVFGDGLRCAAGVLKRIGVKIASGGTVSYPEPGDLGIRARSAALGDVIPPGGVRFYQVYYRDPNLGFCPAPPGNSWNVSNGMRIVWP